jgi:hypothetical protein
LELAECLTETEYKLAPKYAGLRRGMMVVTGPPGAGKGVFFNHLSWQDRRMFKGTKVLLDYKPRALFDLNSEDNRYFPFDADFMVNEMTKMAKKSGMVVIEDEDDEQDEWSDRKRKKLSQKELTRNTKSVAKKWIEENDVLLQNGILGLDEFKKYCHNRNPMNKVGVLIGHLVAVWRHLDLLICGMCPFIHEIDAYSILPYMSHEIRMSSGGAYAPTTYFADFYRKKSVTSHGVVNVEGRPIRIRIDGAEPHPEIGVQLLGDHNVDFGDKEKQIVDYLKSRRDGLANLNQIGTGVDEDIDTLCERLLYLHRMEIVQCKRFFDIYNSKNYANLNPRVHR